MEAKGYRKEIIKLVKEIEDSEILKLIYWFTRSGYREEKAGRK